MLSLARINIIFKKSETAFHLIQKAIENKRINPQAYYLAGVGYLDMGDTLSAINSFQTATQQDMNHFDAWLYLGMIYKGKNYVLADGYFKNAIRINPESKVAWYLLGMHYQNLSKIKESESAYDSALRIDPRFKDALYAKGYLLLVETDKYEEAIKLFSDALIIDPKFTDALYNRGYAYELNGQKELAKKDYEDVLKLQANYSKAVQGLNRL
jgi:tetratricopeptide (TPR) repeat protein